MGIKRPSQKIRPPGPDLHRILEHHEDPRKHGESESRQSNLMTSFIITHPMKSLLLNTVTMGRMGFNRNFAGTH